MHPLGQQLPPSTSTSAIVLFAQVIQNAQALDKSTNTPTEGCLFLTYSTLISNVRGRSRLQQLVEWVGGADFDGAVVLDECHKGGWVGGWVGGAGQGGQAG
jgi:hypothetical protein